MRALTRIGIVFLLLGFFSPQGAMGELVKIPHWIEFRCTPYLPGEYGYPKCHAGHPIRWEPIEGATSYQVEDLQTGFVTTYQHPTSEKGQGGCGPCGVIPSDADCCAYQQTKFRENYSSTYSRYQVFAFFPDTGNPEVSKKADVTGIVYPGDIVDYIITYKNTGAGDLSGVEIIETLPEHIEFVSGGSSHVGQEVRWDIGTLAPGQEGTVTLKVKIDENLPPSINRIYNVAVNHLGGTTGSVGLGVGLCDYLVSQTVYGDVEWTEYPAPDYKGLLHKDEVMGRDHVRANSGLATFDHTIVGGVLTLAEGGFTPKSCNLLDYPAIAELTLDDDSSSQHSISGILNTDEHVLVHSEFLTLNIHDGDYTLDSSGGIETVNVTRGTVTVTDPNDNVSAVAAGESFSWPAPAAATGPQISGTTPENLQSLTERSFAITYTFDQPVTSISGESLFFYSMACNLYTLAGTFDSLGDLLQSWNGSNTELTLTVNNSNPYTVGFRNNPCEVTVTTQFKDVVGAVNTSDNLVRSIHIFNTTKTTGAGALQNIFNNFAIGSHADGTFDNNTPYSLDVVDTPGALPTGMRLLSPVYNVHVDGSVTSAYEVALKPTSPERMTNCAIGGGVYLWQDPSWQQLSEGISPDWSRADVSTSDVTVAMLAKSGNPQVPEILSVSHMNPSDQITPTNPLVVRVKGDFGLDLHQTDVKIGGQRIWTYSPTLGTYPNWAVTYSGNITILTYTPPSGWSHSFPLYGFIKVAGCFGSLPTQTDIGKQSSAHFPWGMVLPAIINNTE